MRGHPTAPGPRDPFTYRAGRQDVADGSPGVPRVRFAEDGSSHADGIPQNGRPIQPGVTYEGENTNAIPWIAKVLARKQELAKNLRDMGTPD